MWDVDLVAPNIPPITIMGFQNIELCQKYMFNLWLNPKLGMNGANDIHNFMWRKPLLQLFNQVLDNNCALLLHILHYHKPINPKNPTQSTCYVTSFVSHIGTSIKVESYMVKPNCWFSKPSMVQSIIGIRHGVQKIAQNILAHRWTIHQNTFDTIGLHTPWWQQQNHIWKFLDVAWTFICLE